MKYAYLVYCNREPIIYAVCSNLDDAIGYANSLVKYRENKPEFDGFYHIPTLYPVCKGLPEGYNRDRLCFHACIRTKVTDRDKEYGDNGCVVKVERRPIYERPKGKNGKSTSKHSKNKRSKSNTKRR